MISSKVRDSRKTVLKRLLEEDDVEMADVKTSRAPDRHDVYKIHMPTGKTAKTRGILEKQEALRKKGKGCRER